MVKKIRKANNRIAKMYLIDRSISKMLTMDNGIYLATSGGYEFLKLFDLFKKEFSNKYLKMKLTKSNCKTIVEDRFAFVGQKNGIDLDSIVVPWTLVMFYWFRQEVKLKFYLGRASDVSEQRLVVNDKIKIYKTVAELRNVISKIDISTMINDFSEGNLNDF